MYIFRFVNTSVVYKELQSDMGCTFLYGFTLILFLSFLRTISFYFALGYISSSTDKKGKETWRDSYVIVIRCRDY